VVGLAEYKVSTKYITIIKDMYDNVMTSFKQVIEILMTFQLI
jgi:hypothetical protein